MSPGDVIVEAGEEAVSTPADVLARAEAQKEKGRGSILLLLHGAGEMRFVALGLGE